MSIIGVGRTAARLTGDFQGHGGELIEIKKYRQ